MAYSAESMYGMTTEEAQQAAQEETTFVNQSQQGRLQKLIEEKNSEEKPISALIRYITANTTRVAKGFVTREDEFIYDNRKPVPKDIPYHVHYTMKFEEYFMTGNEHNDASVVIYKTKQPTDFSRYQDLNPQAPMQLKESVQKPNLKDNARGFMKRYFASKPNDSNPPFEVSKKDYKTSPLYTYCMVIWHFKGTANAVNGINDLALERAERKMQGMRKAIPNLQYFIEESQASKKEITLSKISKIAGTVQTTQQTTTQTQTQTQTQQSPAPPGYNAGSGGPPPGAGGGGGSGGY